MTDRLGQIETLHRLRAREVDRQTRAVAAAVAASEHAADELVKAERRRQDACETLERARFDRAASPADDCVRFFVDACEARLADAQAVFAGARDTLDRAREHVAAARRLWLRAQARYEALGRLSHQVRSKQRRSMDRRRADEANDRAATANGMVMA
jgi:flagellar biosynthesis chaperone FliJ